jgi:hypothetical protein
LFCIGGGEVNYHDVEFKILWALTPCTGVDKDRVMEELVVSIFRITGFYSGHEDKSNFKVFVSKKDLRGNIQYYTY